jgi:serine/threonine protein kinase
MSPEQVSGRALTAASDQFSLATLVVELLTGARPFDGPTPLETMDRIREASPPALDGLGPELGAVLQRALAKDPGQRFPSSRALRSALLASGPVADELTLADHLAALQGSAQSMAVAQTRIDTVDH